jgi:hypothetical protein
MDANDSLATTQPSLVIDKIIDAPVTLYSVQLKKGREMDLRYQTHFVI